MSELSQLLSDILERKEISIANVAQSSKIDRPTVYQYISGKRPLKNRGHLDAIADCLQLTPDEREEMEEAYRILQIGRERYEQRKKVLSLFQLLSSCMRMKGSRENRVHIGLPEGCETYHGSIPVEQIAGAVVGSAFHPGGRLDVLMPPVQKLLSCFRLLSFLPDHPYVRHIFCAENGKTAALANMDSLGGLLQCACFLRNYQPLCYYGRGEEHFGAAAMMPGLILTDNTVLQISADGKNGVLHRDPKVVKFFQDQFDRMEKLCKPLMEMTRMPMDCLAVTDRQMYTHSVPEEPFYTIGFGLCPLPFLDAYLISKYLVQDQEKLGLDRKFGEKLLRSVEQSAMLPELYHLAALEAGEYFVSTGCFLDIAPKYVKGPLTPEDRKYYLQIVRRAMEQERYTICFFPEAEKYLDPQWSAIVQPGANVCFQLLLENEMCYIQIREPGMVSVFCDCAEALMDSKDSTTREESIALLDGWIKKLDGMIGEAT